MLLRMADDDRWEQLVADTEGGDVTRGKMFGSEGLRTGTKFFAIWWHDQLGQPGRGELDDQLVVPPDREELGARAQAFRPEHLPARDITALGVRHELFPTVVIGHGGSVAAD